MEIKARARIELIQTAFIPFTRQQRENHAFDIYRVLTFCSQGVHHQKTIIYTMKSVIYDIKEPIPTTTPFHSIILLTGCQNLETFAATR